MLSSRVLFGSHLSLPSTLASLGSNAFYKFMFKDASGGVLAKTPGALAGGVFEGGSKVLRMVS